MTKPPTSDISQSSAAAKAVLPSMFRSRLFQMFLKQEFWHAHHVDLVWRFNGEDIHEEADWLKDVWYALLRSTPQPPPEAGSVEERKQWGYALKRCAESQRRLAREIDMDNPDDPWASLMVWDDVSQLENMHAALFTAPAPKESP